MRRLGQIDLGETIVPPRLAIPVVLKWLQDTGNSQDETVSIATGDKTTCTWHPSWAGVKK